jgi:hypothetical protein
MNSKSILRTCSALLPLLIATPVIAQGTAFNYQGHLSDGINAATGIYDLRFAIFDGSTNGNAAAGPITQNAVDVRSGLFSVTLDFGPAVFTGSNRWLEISVRTNGDSIFTTLLPRQPLLPTPYAITAANLSGTLGATQLNGVLPSSALAGDYSAILNFNNESNHYAGDGTALKFGGFGYCALPCYWNLSGNAGTTPGQNFVGTTDNTPLEFRVNGQRVLRLEPTTNSPNVIGGFEGNYVDGGGTGNTIGGGGTVDSPNRVWARRPDEDIHPLFSTIAGGAGNSIADSHFATIAGGSANLIRKDSSIAREYDTIGGGFANVIIDGGGSTIAGGSGNALQGEIGNVVRYSVIGGGIGNLISSDSLETVAASTIAGGEGNQIWRTSRAAIVGGSGNRILFYSDGATIAGGKSNFIDIDSPLAFIAGGSGNSIGHKCANSVIGGGNGNTIATLTDIAFATVSGGTVSGGQSNTVTGLYGTVAGGRLNVATNSAFAAGTRAKALHSRSFVWAAGNTNDYPSSTTNRVHFYAAGGLAVEYAGQDQYGRGLKWLVLASQEPGKVINVYNGAYLSEGGAWTDTSDRNAKEKFEPVDSKEILERVTNLPLTSWSYRSESNSVRHLGPVAQDFHEAFGLGADDKHIAGLDSSGVALAAIQGLSQELKAKQTEIDQLKQRLEALERRLDGLAR